jgi:DNA-directed RNA polymerase subunit RPC12/RpoP
MAVKKFPCSSCGAKFEFAPGAALKCPYCGAANEIPQSKAEIRELDFKAFLSQAATTAEVQENQTVKCDSCGAEQTLDPTVTTSHCAFCGSQMHAEAETQRLIKPSSLLPFKIDKKVGLESYRSWINGLWFAPSDLKRYAQVDGSLKGIYIPYWTYDANTWTWYDGERGIDYTETETYEEKDEDGNSVTKERQVVRTVWTPVSGMVYENFDDVLVLASWSLPREKTEALEPWDLQNLVGYQVDYLAGFQSEAYQVDLAQGFEHAKKKMEDVIDGLIRQDIGGDHQRIHSTTTQYNDLTFKHILLPIWICAYRYGGKAFRFVINGRTGEVQGERPYSVIKIILASAAAVAAGGLIWWLVKAFGG